MRSKVATTDALSLFLSLSLAGLSKEQITHLLELEMAKPERTETSIGDLVDDLMTGRLYSFDMIELLNEVYDDNGNS